MASEEGIYRVFVDPAANDRMAEHVEFLAKVNRSAASKLLNGLIGDIRSLEKMPLGNPVYDRPYLPPLKYHYIVSNKRYRIVYQVVDDVVFVDDIQDTRQSDDKSLLNL